MRLAGDPDGCLDVVRVLERCSASLQSMQDEAHPPSMFDWTGTSSLLWSRSLLGHVADAGELAAQAQAAARALRTFADGLVELQARARQLEEEAAAARLVLHDDGSIDPVPVAADPELQFEQQRRTEVRTEVVRGAQNLLAEQDDLHTALLRASGQQVVPPAEEWSGPSTWMPGLGDATSAVLAATTAGLQVAADDGLRLVGRVSGSTPVGAVITATTELAGGASPVDAALTAVVVTAGASSGGGLAMAGMAGVTLLAAPVAVPAGVALAAVAAGGLVGGYVADRLWDAHGQDVKRAGGRLVSSARLPWVDRPSAGRRRRRH